MLQYLVVVLIGYVRKRAIAYYALGATVCATTAATAATLTHMSMCDIYILQQTQRPMIQDKQIVMLKQHQHLQLTQQLAVYLHQSNGC
jgi:hypothetical protein